MTGISPVQARKIATEKRRRLESEFNRQMNILRWKHCPGEIIETFFLEKNRVVQKALESEMDRLDQERRAACFHFPFCAVAPIGYIGLYGLLAMARPLSLFRKKTGFCFDFRPEQITSSGDGVPKYPYFMIDVDVVDIDFSGEAGVSTVKRDGRLCHNLAEDAALLAFFGGRGIVNHRPVGLWCPETVLREDRLVYFFQSNDGPSLGESWLTEGRSGMRLRIASSGRRLT